MTIMMNMMMMGTIALDDLRQVGGDPAGGIVWQGMKVLLEKVLGLEGMEFGDRFPFWGLWLLMMGGGGILIYLGTVAVHRVEKLVQELGVGVVRWGKLDFRRQLSFFGGKRMVDVTSGTGRRVRKRNMNSDLREGGPSTAAEEDESCPSGNNGAESPPSGSQGMMDRIRSSLGRSFKRSGVAATVKKTETNAKAAPNEEIETIDLAMEPRRSRRLATANANKKADRSFIYY